MAPDVSLAGAAAESCPLSAEGIETIMAHEKCVEDVNAVGELAAERGRESRSRAPPWGGATSWSGRSGER